MAGEDEEDVIEIRGVHRQSVGLDRGVVEPVEQNPQRPHPAIAGDPQRERVVVARGRIKDASGRVQPGDVGEL
jgi:hypothetical protein